MGPRSTFGFRRLGGRSQQSPPSPGAVVNRVPLRGLQGNQTQVAEPVPRGRYPSFAGWRPTLLAGIQLRRGRRFGRPYAGIFSPKAAALQKGRRYAANVEWGLR